MSKRRVVCLGLDGGSFDLIDPWVEAGYLPNIKKLLTNGSRATLKSVVLPFTPQAWGSFMTGVNPGRHGVFGFKQKAKGKYSFQFVNNTSLKVKTMLEFLTDMNKKVVFVNIPMTYPPPKVAGMVIAGMDSPGIDSDFTYPPELKKEILQIAKDYVIHLHVGAGYLDTDAKRKQALTGLLRMIAAREKLSLHLLTTAEWDLFAVNFSATDQVQHHFWQFMDKKDHPFGNALLSVYQRVDEAIGKIVATLDEETTLFIMSDHGAGSLSDRVIFIDEWLAQQGWLKFRKSSWGKASLRQLVHFLLTFLSRHLSSQKKDLLMRLFPQLRVRSQGFVRRSLIDWSATRVYSGEYPATLRINLKGRDAEGIVSPDGEYQALLENLITQLQQLSHPETGEKLIEKVYRREEIYHGPYMKEAPELIICTPGFAHQLRGGPFPKGYQNVISKKDNQEVGISGGHRLHGIFIAHGKNIRPHFSLPVVNIIDLFPTILCTLGVEIPETVEGRVIADIFAEEFLAHHAIKYMEYDLEKEKKLDKETYSKREAEKVEKHLRSLGYLD